MDGARETVVGCGARLANGLAGWLFPARCVACGARERDMWLCADCLSHVVPLRGSRCPICAARLVSGLCPACARERPAFRRVFAAGAYRGVVRQAVHALKFGGVRELAAPLSRLMAEACEALPERAVVVPVPASPQRRAERWLDHAGLLAAATARELALPCRPEWAERCRATTRQVGLGPAARRANVAGAFRARQGVRGAAVLVVDDVMTTGATARSLARALVDAGAAEVYVAVAARADEPPDGGVSGGPAV